MLVILAVRVPENKMSDCNLVQKAHNIRCKTLETAYYTGASHIGGSLSTVEILTVLYYKTLNINPDVFKSDERDRFILSKGHGALALYAILADKKFYDQKELHSVKRFHHLLQGHPVKDIPGIEMSSGSLGQGISFAVGKAFALKRKKKSGARCRACRRRRNAGRAKLGSAYVGRKTRLGKSYGNNRCK